MNIGALLKTFIYIISSSLLYPVLFLLVVLTIWILIYSGSFFAEWMERIRIKNGILLDKRVSDLEEGIVRRFVSNKVREYLDSLNELFLSDHVYDVELETENLLQEKIIAIWASLDRIKMFIRIGPGLGLIGTLIPMGSGLAALGQGDMTRLSSDLVIAFTTTVVGLAIGMCSYFFYTIQRRWVEKDIKDMSIITELVVNSYKRNGKNEVFKEKGCGEGLDVVRN